MFDLANQAAVVIGGTSGIGLTLAKGLAQGGRQRGRHGPAREPHGIRRERDPEDGASFPSRDDGRDQAAKH